MMKCSALATSDSAAATSRYQPAGPWRWDISVNMIGVLRQIGCAFGRPTHATVKMLRRMSTVQDSLVQVEELERKLGSAEYNRMR